VRLSHLPLRVTTGAFILNSGLSKRGLPAEAAAGMQQMARSAVPQLDNVSPATFGRALSASEVALGAALLTPFVSPVVAGAALTAFSGTLLRMWWQTPGMHEEGSLRPTEQGTAIAKDVWMLGAGLALVLDGLSDGARKTVKQSRRSARRKAKAARAALPVG
jgi:hypothetical protein